MKLKRILTMMVAGASVLGAMAQTHLEGEEYYKADQLENARDLLIRSLNNPQTDKAVSDYYLGMIALEEKKANDAANYFAKGIAANPDYAYNYVGQGLLALQKGDKKGAETLFKEAQKHSKKDASLEIAIARAYDMVNPVEYAKEIAKQVEKARKYNMQNPDIYIFEGDQFKQEALGADQASLPKIAGQAAAKYDMAKGYDPSSSVAYVKYANLYNNFNPKYAIQNLQELLKNNPSSALGQRELALAYYNNKDYEEAAKVYGTYVQNPSHFKSDESQYSFLLFSGGDFKKGYEYATALLNEDPSNFTAQRYQFMNAAQLPEMKDQMLSLAESLYNNHKKNPTKNKFATIDYTLIADEYQNSGKYDDAISILNEGIIDFPEQASFHKDLAMVYVNKEEFAKASDVFLEYINKTKNPSYNDYIQQALFAYFGATTFKNKSNESLNKYSDLAIEYANLAVDKDSSQYKPYVIFGDVKILNSTNDKESLSIASDDYSKAINLLEVSKDPSRYTSDAKKIYLYLGYYNANNNIAKAKEYFNKYLQLAPNDTAVRDYVNKLK